MCVRHLEPSLAPVLGSMPEQTEELLWSFSLPSTFPQVLFLSLFLWPCRCRGPPP